MRAKSARCVHEVGGLACGAVPAQPCYVPMTLAHQSAMHSAQSLHIHGIICYFVQLSTGPCETIKMKVDCETRNL